MTTELFFAGFTGQLKTVTSLAGVRYTFTTPVPVRKGKGYVIMVEESKTLCHIVPIVPPPYQWWPR